jgi:hypothetical protein
MGDSEYYRLLVAYSDFPFLVPGRFQELLPGKNGSYYVSSIVHELLHGK